MRFRWEDTALGIAGKSAIESARRDLELLMLSFGWEPEEVPKLLKPRTADPEADERRGKLRQIWQEGELSREQAAIALNVSISTIKRDSRLLKITWKRK